MAPALSDDEISNNGAVSDTEERLEVVEPDKASGTSKRQLASRAVPRMIASEDEENGEEVDEELNDEIDEDEYVVEAILTHMLNDLGEVRFKVKWLGYEKKSDQTWEPEDNLIEGANELLQEYYEKVGGREFVMSGKKKPGKRGRQPKSSTPQENESKRRKAVDISEPGTPQSVKDIPRADTREYPEQAPFVPPASSWEEEVQSIDAVENVEGDYRVYLKWNNGKMSVHPREMCNKRCPQKMLKFYESHTSFVPPSSTTEAQTNVVLESLSKRRGRPPKTNKPV